MTNEEIQRIIDQQRQERDKRGCKINQPGWLESKIGALIVSETQEIKEKISKTLKQTYTHNPDIVEQQKASRKDTHKTEEWKELASKVQKEVQNRPEVKAKKNPKISATLKAKSDEISAIQRVVQNRPELRKKNSERSLERYSDPKRHPRYSGATVGTNIETRETVVFHSNKEILAAGFQPGAISLCVNGKQASHKGYTWSRQPIDVDSGKNTTE